MKSFSSKRLILFLVCLLFLALAQGNQPLHAAWQLVWSDEFNGSTVDTSKWTFETENNSGWGNSEREYYTGRTNNAYVAGGALHIVAQRESYGGLPYTSARMKTQSSFSKEYGRFEFRARLPQGVGFWPALWMLGANISTVGWPACGEIDVMENNGSWSNQVQGTIHYSDSGNNHLQQTKLFTLPLTGDSVTNFHTYAVEWSTNSIKWLVDSNTIQTWTTWSSSSGPYPAPYNQPFFIILNLAVGGSYLNWPTDAQINSGTTFPGEMQVDYVRVYDYVTVAAPPAAPTGLLGGAANTTAFLSWNAPAEGATGYNVKRASSSGGPYTVIGSTATNSYADAGLSACADYYYVVSATNSFGESTNSSELALTLGAFAFAVNSGGGAAGQFAADANVTGGTQAAPVTTSIDTSGVTNPAPQAVYQTERFGNFTYTFTNLSPGLGYKVRLHFAETYWTAAGQRRFNVLINGAQVLTNFDIFAAAGAEYKATVQEFTAVPSSGRIVIQYVTVTDNAKSSGIELLLPRATAPALLKAIPGNSASALSWSPLAGSGITYNVKRALVNGGPYALLSAGLTGTNYTDSGLTNGTTYYYVVSAVNAGCESANSPQAAATLVPSLALQPSGAKLALIWPSGTLQVSTNVSGPWSDLPQATNPYPVIPTQPRQFFRIKALQ